MTGSRRQPRADRTANRQRILATATRMFADRGVDVPLDEIAAVAGVGSATLHRNFTGRLDLVHSILDIEAQRVACRAAELASEADSGRALTEWLRALIEFTCSFRGLATLLGAHQADTTLEERHRSLYAAAGQLLGRCRSDGTVSADVTVGDLLKLANAVSIAAGESAETAQRYLTLLINGLLSPSAAFPARQ